MPVCRPLSRSNLHGKCGRAQLELTEAMTSVHGKVKKIAKLLSGMSEYLRKFLSGATQLDEKARWSTLLRRIFW